MTQNCRILALTFFAALTPVLFSGCSLDDLAADLEGNSSRYGTNKKKTQPPRVSPTRTHQVVLAGATRKNTRVVIDIGRQKAYLLVSGKVGLECPISSARSGKYTPRGTFRVTERIRTGKHSTIYGVEMPYWMRLSGTVFGVHAGYLPGYPASAGCVRLPADAARLIYDNTGYGTQVSIVSAWSGS
ncbi:MAG: L,D-transpeptidase [Verrucomicrobiales bacterium]|nr:L,D-transpeptidase [Verrucomicrobiales bacterium]